MVSTSSPDPEDWFCRDCHTFAPNGDIGAANRCPHCHGPRLIRHDEFAKLAIAHIDCDAFYAAVEKRDNPELVNQPVIVGGGRRGVVSTACYIARINGVHSAQPMFKALKACPEAIVIKPNMAKYSAVGREIRNEMLKITPLVEPLSIDEAFLDLTGTERLHRMCPAETLSRFAEHIENTVGISISIGLSFNKFLAKIASDLDKPRGFSIIGRQEARAFLAQLPVTKIWGVGKAFHKKLKADGIETIETLQTMDEATLAKAYGAMGLRLYKLARADDTRLVSPERKAKSVSAETTFNDDIADIHTLETRLRRQCDRVSAQLKTKDLCGQTVTLKLKDADFKIKTRNRRLGAPTQLSDRIYRASRALLENEVDGTRYRLLGVGVSDLHEAGHADPDDLIDTSATKRAHAERAMDKLRDKFGKDAVTPGMLFQPPKTPSGH